MNTSNQFILLGLGNKGEYYKYTRHNIGFILINLIKKFYKLTEFKEKNKMIFSSGIIKNKKFFLCKENSFINLTGQITKNFLKQHNVKNYLLIIIHDDLKLKIKKIKIKKRENSSSHNGLKNINEHIKNQYLQLKIGIGEPISNINDYVLKPFKKKECYHLTILFQKLLHILPLIIEGKAELFLNRINEIKTKNYNAL